MNFRVILILLLLFFAGHQTVHSQEAAIVTIMPAKPVTVATGQTTQVTVTAKIKKGFHIQANPAADEFLIPTTLTIEAGDGIIPGIPVYPSGHPYKLKGGTEVLLTYEDEVMISLPVTVLDSALTGMTGLAGGLRVQPCDDRKCFSPRTIPVTIPVEIVQPQK